jgi:hypothetical protein
MATAPWKCATAASWLNCPVRSHLLSSVHAPPGPDSGPPSPPNAGPLARIEAAVRRRAASLLPSMKSKLRTGLDFFSALDDNEELPLESTPLYPDLRIRHSERRPSRLIPYLRRIVFAMPRIATTATLRPEALTSCCYLCGEPSAAGLAWRSAKESWRTPARPLPVLKRNGR